MQKVPGVGKVEVRLNQGLTILDLETGNRVTLAALRGVIRNNGFTAPEANVIAIGTVTALDGRLVFEIAESRERWPLVASPAQPGPFDDLRRQTASGSLSQVELRGTVQLNGKPQTPLAVSAFRVR